MKDSLRVVVRFSLSFALICAILLTYFKLLPANPTTVALSLLLAILIISATWGLRYAVFMSFAAALGFNYFFLPPVLTFTIADTQNWVALAAFLITAIIASQLSERARREALNAKRRRHEIERLYAFSQQLLISDNVMALLNAIPGYVADTFAATAAALFVGDTQQLYFTGSGDQGPLSAEELKAVAGRGEPVLDREHQSYLMPVRLGVRTVGAIGMTGGNISRETLEAVASLIAISIERAGAIEKLTRAEAARESERLRTVLLDSVAHEFRTPLTAIKAAAEALLESDGLAEAQQKELLAVIDEESNRLNRLVGEATEMAQLETQEIELHFELHPIRDAIDAALQDARRSLQNHPVELQIPPDLPPVRVDLPRIKEVLVQLLENAGKYSPAGTPILISAEVQGKHLVTSVADRGPGIDNLELNMIFDKFYRGRMHRHLVQGTGMGLPIAKAIIEAHGGTVTVTSQPSHGSVLSFSLPLG